LSQDNSNRESIMRALSRYMPEDSREDAFEMRAQHIISSAMNLLESLEREYDTEEFDQLKKRFISSIRGNDPKRFSRSIMKIKESKE
jgi:hypothetical protein